MINPVSMSGLTAPVSNEALQGPAESRGASFSNVLGQLLGSAGQSHESAGAALREMATGQTDNLHEVMLQMAQADLSFHLILEIRNRLSEAYQEIMKMNV